MPFAQVMPQLSLSRPTTGTPQLIQPTFDARTFRIVVLLVAVAILNGIDLLYTLFANRIHMLNEMNPLAAVYPQLGLIISLISYKALMVLCGLGMLWKLRSSRLTVPACWVLLLAYTYLGVEWYRWVCVVNYNFEVRLAAALP